MITKYISTDEQGFIKVVIIDEILNKHNDMLAFYVFFDNGIYCINDDCETLFNINPDMTIEISEILKKYGVSFVEGRLFINAKKDELVKREKDFTDALREINKLGCVL